MNAVWIRLQRNWFRNLLAILQVAIAIAAVTAVLVDVLPVLLTADESEPTTYVARFGAQSGGTVMWSSLFHPEDVMYLMEEATTLEAVSTFQNDFQPTIMVDGERYMVRGKGAVSPSFAKLVDVDMVAGTFFTEQDARASTPRVAVVSDELATFLFGSVDVIGKTINLRPNEESSARRFSSSPERLAQALAMPGDDVEIIGVFRSNRASPAMTFGLGRPAEVLVPMTIDESQVTQALVGEILYRPKEGMAREAEEEVRQLLRSRLAQRGDDERTMDGVKLDVMVSPHMGPGQLAQARSSGFLLLGGLGLAALVVSSIAMFTTTLANLAPRTRYIGLGRALGATRSRVVKEVVFESAMLAGMGGIVGVAAAFPLRSTVFAPLFSSAAGGAGSTFLNVLMVGLVGVALAVVVGAVAALYPAWTVARLAPADAWREGTV